MVAEATALEDFISKDTIIPSLGTRDASISKRVEEAFTVVDLFSGAGGLGLGFEMALDEERRKGFSVIGNVDFDLHCIKTQQRNSPDAVSLKADMTEMKTDTLKRQIGLNGVDLVIGGPPCQGFSTIGRVKIASLVKNGTWKHMKNHEPRFIDDPRNRLYKEFVRVVRDLRPKFFVMENVPGMLSYHHGKIAEQVIEDFKSIGYRTDARILVAADYGVPQIRKRVIFIGNRLNRENPYPTKTHVPVEKFSEFPDETPYVTVWDAIGDLPVLKSGEGKEEMKYTKPAKTDYQRWSREGSPNVWNHVSRTHREDDIEIFMYMKEGMYYKDLPDKYKRYRDDIFNDKFKKLVRRKPSWTVMSHLYKDGYMYIHPTQARTITVREAARLQSFPDTFKFMGARTHQFKQVGNAVPPLMARAIAEALLNGLSDDVGGTAS